MILLILSRGLFIYRGGRYRDREGHPHTLNCVRKAEQILLDIEAEKYYQYSEEPSGDPVFNSLVEELVLGKVGNG